MLLEACLALSALAAKLGVILAFFARPARDVQRTGQVVVLHRRIFHQVHVLVEFDQKMGRMYRIDKSGVKPALLHDSRGVDGVLQTHLLAVGQHHADGRLDVVVVAQPAKLDPEPSAVLNHQALVVHPPRAQVKILILPDPLEKSGKGPAERNERRHVVLVQTDKFASPLGNPALDRRKRVSLKRIHLDPVFARHDLGRPDLDDFRYLIALMSQSRFQVKYDDLHERFTS